jgi:hypothetical protein
VDHWERRSCLYYSYQFIFGITSSKRIVCPLGFIEPKMIMRVACNNSTPCRLEGDKLRQAECIDASVDWLLDRHVLLGYNLEGLAIKLL